MKILKRILMVLAMVITLTACESMFEVNWPDPPYPNPNDTSYYEEKENNYYSVTYIYYCYNGEYKAITYTCTSGCQSKIGWDKSVYTSTGICK